MSGNLKINISTIKSNGKSSSKQAPTTALPTDVTYAFGKSISSFAIHLWLL